MVVPEPAVSQPPDRQKVGDQITPAKNDGASQRVFDEAAALDRVEGNRELLRSMVGLFATQWRGRLAEIARAAKRRDGAALEMFANLLKQSLGSFGAGKASRVAQELAEFGRNQRFHDLEKTCARLRIEIERLVSALEEFSKVTIPDGSR